MKPLVALGRRLGLAVVVAGMWTAVAADRDGAWREVEAALEQNLPRTAIEKLGPIAAAAVAEGAWPEAAKAVLRRMVLEAAIEGDQPEERIRRLEPELEQAPTELKPVYETALAHGYWQYVQQNRWRFAGRTAVAGAASGDFTTWDLPRLMSEVDRHFQNALAAAPALRQVPVSAYGSFLEPGTMPDACRPTLYDVVVHEALAFYSAGEQGATRPEDAFEVDAAGPVFGSLEAFANWKPVDPGLGAGRPSPMFRAVQLFQALLEFHGSDADKTALAEADLDRLVWGRNVAVGEEKDARFEAALGGFVERWADLPVSARALHRWAELKRNTGALAEAETLAARGQRTYPDSPGGKLCRNLRAELLQPSLQASTESVWAAPWPKIQITYRNLTNAHLRLFALDWEGQMHGRMDSPESMDEEARRRFLGGEFVREWTVPLPPTPDFQERSESIAAPPDLEPGYYCLAVSTTRAFDGKNGQVSVVSLWVSDLAVVVRPGVGRGEGLVLDARTGEPVAGADVELWSRESDGPFTREAEVRSDPEGYFEFREARAGYRASVFRVRHGGQAVATGPGFWTTARSPRFRRVERTHVFTDRAIYRPGQGVHFKAVCFFSDPGAGTYGVLAGRKVVLALVDPNGRVIARTTQAANDFGSVAGIFTAPLGGLTGPHFIRVEQGPGGQAGFSVEEYKRPKFEVTLDAPADAPRLGEKVTLVGRAAAYTGAAIDAAAVGYRVARRVRFAPWMWWRGGFPRSAEALMTHGTAVTGVDGTFEITFVARPDRAVPERDQPTFEYEVTVDVTDSAGETRSASRSVRAGYVALECDVEVAEWVTAGEPLAARIRTTSLEGEPQAAEGVLRLYQLQQPSQVVRPGLEDPSPRWFGAGPAAHEPDPSGPEAWGTGALLAERTFFAGTNGWATNHLGVVAGAYRLVAETQDRFGRKVLAQRTVLVVDPEAELLETRVPNLLVAPRWSVEPGGEFVALWGTGYDSGRAFVEIEHRGKVLQRYWTAAGRTQEQIRQVVTEDLRGGFQLRVTRVRENRAYLETRTIDVPWSNKRLELAWERFRSRLEPGQPETWSLVLRQPSAGEGVHAREPVAAAAELVATLYDASLDAFRPLSWPVWSSLFYRDVPRSAGQAANRAAPFQVVFVGWGVEALEVDIRFRRFPDWLMGGRGMELESFAAGGAAPRGIGLRAAPTAAMAFARTAGEPMPAAAMIADAGAVEGAEVGRMAKSPTPLPPTASSVPAAGAAAFSPRKNLNETAFFLPQLRAGTNGEVRLEFTMPEALTTWRFLGLAHDRELRLGLLEAEAVTSRDLMVQPNPPRFLREGDELEFTVKISNQSDQTATGGVRLNLFEAATDRPVDRLLGNRRPEQDFEVPAKESRSYSWRLKVPDGLGFLTYRATARAGAVADGEEGPLPVLTRRVFLTESMPLAIRGPGTNRFEFGRLKESGKSSTLEQRGVTVQMVSNPAWYAVMALPFLMEHPHECAEQVFNRYYANALARFLANSDPRIRRVFDQWVGTSALDSPLEQNQDLKALAIEEAPWLREAQDESRARRQVGLLFEDARVNAELAKLSRRLQETQLPDGAWAWFPGGRRNDYITLYIVGGFGRLRHLGADAPIDQALRALGPLDGWMTEAFRRIQALPKPEEHVPTPTEALYLYARSFYLKDRPLAGEAANAVAFFLAQARAHWVKLDARQSQGHLALALHRWGGAENATAAAAILRSLKERSVATEEMGRFWRDDERSWWWHRAPIETQALMIEAFDEVTADAEAVESCKVWLLKQKQTRDWKTTKATADAVYALLLRGRDLLASTNLVAVELGGRQVLPAMATDAVGAAVAKAEPGTGFSEVRFPATQVTPGLGDIVVRKVDEGVAWGGVYWQYLEDLAKVTPHAGTPLQLRKDLFVRRTTAQGQVLEPIGGSVAVGDELITRVELRTDRDMEFVHLKDQRGSGTEPVNVLSGYRFQDGLGYYENTRDTATHFFIDYLPRGTYVFEYASRVQHRGAYPAGMAEIQCMYAPEFSSHSGSTQIVVP